MTRRSRAAGFAILTVLAVVALAAPFVATSDPWRQHADLAYSPPMRPRIVDRGQLRAPFVYPLRVEDRLERRYGMDESHPTTLVFFTHGRLASTEGGVWFPLGADPLGRDVFSRMAYGAQLSLAVAITATILTIGIGALAGAIAGYAGGFTDRVISTIADFIVILPAAYVVVTLRASLPLVLTKGEVFWTMVLVLAAASWPLPARGVRAIVWSERHRAVRRSCVLRWGQDGCGFCYVTSCPRPARISRCRLFFYFPRLFSPKPRSPSSASDLRNPPQAGA